MNSAKPRERLGVSQRQQDLSHLISASNTGVSDSVSVRVKCWFRSQSLNSSSLCREIGIVLQRLVWTEYSLALRSAVGHEVYSAPPQHANEDPQKWEGQRPPRPPSPSPSTLPVLPCPVAVAQGTTTVSLSETMRRALG